MSLAITNLQQRKTTTSLCPECKRQIPAVVFERGGEVFLRKTCPQHGEFEVLINSDKRWYFDSVGAGAECQCTPGHCDEMIERGSTCIALIELVDSCNLPCPTCYASSPLRDDGGVDCLSVDEFWRRIDAVIARKGPLEILQLSGGEPTLHPEFFTILERVLRDQRIGYTLLNTNGVRIARDDDFARRLGELHQTHRRFELYLQFDGPQKAGQLALRGADLRRVREQTIERAGDFGLPVALAMTVTPDNVGALGDTLRFGLARDAVRGITFQPMFGSGRVHWLNPAGVRRLNVGDVVNGLIRQSAGLLSERDFTPLPCGDPNCHTIGYVLRRDGRYEPVSRHIDFAQVQGFLKDRVNFDIEDLHRCGCEIEPLGRILKSLEIGPDNVFRIFIKPFMDAWTYDQDRIDRCCVHVVGPDGKLDSFCRYYALKS